MPSMFLCILSPLCFCIVIVNLQHQGDVQHGHHHVSVNGRKQPNCSRDLQVESAFGNFHLDSSWKYFQAGRSRTHKQYWSRWKQVSAKKTFCFDLFRNRGDFILTMGRATKGDQRLADIFAKHMVWQAQKYREEYFQKYLTKYLKKHLQPFHQTILNLSSSDRVPCPSSNYQGSPREATFTHSSSGSFLLLKLSPSIILVCDNR